MSDLPTGTVTFLFTDIEGSTRLVRELRASYEKVLAEHQQLLREAFARHGGIEIDTQGDAFMVAFARASDAVNAAVDGQRALAGYDWGDARELRVRMGIHTGQPRLENVRYTGLAVHRAARICAAAHGGQIALSQTTVNLLEDEEEPLPGVALRNLGPQRLKDFDRPVQIYQADADGLAQTFPPLRGLDERVAAGGRGGIRRHQRLTLLAGSLLVLAAAAATLAIVHARDGEAAPKVVARSVVRIDPATNRITDVVETPAVVEQVVATPNHVWFLSGPELGQALFRMNHDGSEMTTFGGTEVPCALTTDPLGRVWIASCVGGRSSVSRIDEETGKPVQTFTVRGEGEVAGLAVDRNAVFATRFTIAGEDVLVRIPLNGDKRTTYPVGSDPFAVVVSDDTAWVANYRDSSLTRIFLVTGASKDMPTASGPLFMAAGAGAVWLSHFYENVVWRIDEVSGLQNATRAFGQLIAQLAANDEGVWAASPEEATVYRLDPKTADVVARVSLGPGHAPAGIAVTDDAVWVAVTPPQPAG